MMYVHSDIQLCCCACAPDSLTDLIHFYTWILVLLAISSEDKKRKPSRDFPAHAQVPVGKHVKYVSSLCAAACAMDTPSE